MRHDRLLLLAAVLWCGLALAGPAATASAPLRVFSSNGVKALLEAVHADLERAVGSPVTLEFSTATALARRMEGGDVPEVAVLTAPIVEALASRGTLAGASRRDLARVGVGVGVRAGTAVVDIGTAEALKRRLLAAPSVTFTAEGQSRPTIDRAFATLGIVEAMRTRTILQGPGDAPGVVVRGEADVVLTLLSEMVGVPGLTVLGPLPPPLQQWTTFTAARATTVADTAATERLLTALTAPEVTARLASLGMEPPAR